MAVEKKSWNFSSNKRFNWNSRKKQILDRLVNRKSCSSRVNGQGWRDISREEFRIFLLLDRSRMTFSIDPLQPTRLCNLRGLPHAQIVLIFSFFFFTPRLSRTVREKERKRERKKKTKEKRIPGRLISISQQKCRVIARNSRLNL